MRLQIYFILMILFTLIVACSVPVLKRDKLSSGYIALVDRDTEKARHLLERISDSNNRKFLRSCLELSEGNLPLAKLFVEQLIAEDSKMPEGLVLVKLIERRSAYPNELWMDSFANAWRAAGYPKLFLHELLGQWEWDADSEKRMLLRSKPDKLFLPYEFGSVPPLEEIVKLTIAKSTPETPMETKLLLLAWLDDVINDECALISNELCRSAKEQRHKLVHQLSIDLPSDIRYAIRDVLYHASGKESFQLTDLNRLEEAVTRQQLGPSRKILYSYYVEKYTTLGLLDPQLSAFNALSRIDIDSYWMKLRIKVMSTAEHASQEVRERLAIILEKAGRAHLQRRTFLDILYGSDLLLFASKLKGDKVGKQRTIELRQFANEMFERAQSASLASLLWPIQSLKQDSIERHIEDEIGVYLLLTGLEIPVDISSIMSNYP